MSEVTLRYGGGEVCLPVEGAKSVVYLHEKPMAEIGDVLQALRCAVEEHSIGMPPLRQVIAPTDEITVILSDLTRFWMRQDLVCEALFDYLTGVCGVRPAQITVLVALGTHRRQTEQELEKIASPRVYAACRVLNHDCDAPDLVYAGTTSRGTRVMVNPLVVGRRVILVGGTVHHLMAGYGGGRKSILPGVCARETIRQNHMHCLCPDKPCSNPLIGARKLENNPVNQDMNEAAAMIAPAYSINIVVSTHGSHSRFFAGHWQRAWLESCEYVQAAYGLAIERQADVVIASCGGFPKDLNLYQGVKTLLNAAGALRPGGTFIFLCQAQEGGGAPDFFDWRVPLAQGRLDEALRKDFTIAGYIFYAACEVIARAGRVLMLTDIAPETLADMRIEAFDDVQALRSQVDFAGKDVYVVPHGGSVVPFVQDVSAQDAQ